jgi:hypothetical protein
MISQTVATLSIVGILFFSFAIIAGVLSAMHINRSEIARANQMSTLANITSCQKLNSTDCGCDKDKCDLCYLYQFNFTWFRNCGNRTQLIFSIDQLIIAAKENFTCQANVIRKCYYSCSSLDLEVSLTPPEIPSTTNWLILLIFALIALVVSLLFGLTIYFVRQKEAEKYESIL